MSHHTELSEGQLVTVNHSRSSYDQFRITGIDRYECEGEAWFEAGKYKGQVISLELYDVFGEEKEAWLTIESDLALAQVKLSEESLIQFDEVWQPTTA